VVKQDVSLAVIAPWNDAKKYREPLDFRMVLDRIIILPL